ncbi:MAG: 1-(5-phosphoribosyl)-5-[(5-phosphoribosylamino)methylideneamino]imidazole-4-carboxamide isomerase [Chloroflexota bacterium]
MPAVDIKDGKCVRLYQGKYNRETIFSNDPVEVALRWQSMGVPRLHVIDLNGAAQGEPVNLDIIKEMASAILIPIQVGGGIREIGTVEQMLRMGVERVILGTVAVENPDMVKELCRNFSEAVIISLDSKEGNIAIHGWLQDTELKVIDWAKSLAELGVKRFIYTDISRDGTLTEPNFTAIAELLDEIRLPVLAAGGITSITHLKILKQLGAEGAIVGRAIYSGDINLKKALAAINQ